MARNSRRRSHGSFIALQKRLLNSDEFGQLSPYAVKLLLEIARHYNGKNNGDLAMPWSWLRERGWRSKSTISKAKRELIDTGFVVVTHRRGRLSRKPTTYAITWEAIDDADDSVEAKASPVALNTWMQKKPSVRLVDRIGTPGGLMRVVK